MCVASADMISVCSVPDYVFIMFDSSLISLIRCEYQEDILILYISVQSRKGVLNIVLHTCAFCNV